MNNESTQNIVPIKDATVDVREIIGEVYDALTEKGYNPVSQVVGYIMSGDPTYHKLQECAKPDHEGGERRDH